MPKNGACQSEVRAYYTARSKNTNSGLQEPFWRGKIIWRRRRMRGKIKPGGEGDSMLTQHDIGCAEAGGEL